MNTPKEPKSDLAHIAYEADQQARRCQILAQALARSHADTATEFEFEGLAGLLESLCDWTSRLADALQEHQP